MSKKPVVGLIGGIGSGKSQVASAFARHGAYLISGDLLGHEALRQADIAASVVDHFGAAILDAEGEISRRRLGAMVFADPAERRELEKRVFPYIERRMQEEIAAGRTRPDARLIVLDAAILLEAGWNRRCDCIVYVHAPRALRLRRLAEQRGWTEIDVREREKAQLPLTEKAACAHHAVDNSGSPDDVERQVAGLVPLITAGE